MHMRPVPLREFQARLRTIRNKFDLLRIFVADKDISDDKLKKLLSATAVTSTDTVVQPHVSERVHASPAATGTRATAVPVGAHVQIDVTQSKRASRSDAVLSKPTESVVKNDRGKTYSSMAKLGELLKKTDVAKSEHSSESDADLSQFTERMAKSDVTKNDALTSRSDSDFADDLFDDVRYANVKKRSEAWYDDEYYSDDEVDAEDYIDGEVEYYNDEKTADAILEGRPLTSDTQSNLKYLPSSLSLSLSLSPSLSVCLSLPLCVRVCVSLSTAHTRVWYILIGKTFQNYDAGTYSFLLQYI